MTMFEGFDAGQAIRKRKLMRGMIALIVPSELKQIDPIAYERARSASSTEAAERIVAKYADELNFRGCVLTKSRTYEKDRMGFLQSTSSYSKGTSNPAYFDDRDPVDTGCVEEFSTDTVPPPRTPDRLDVQPGVALPITASREWLGLPFNARPTKDL
jgi:hypothetical protein